MSFSARDNRAAILGVIGLALILITRFVAIPFCENWADTRDNIAVSQDRLQKFERKIRRILSRQGELTRTYGQGALTPLKDIEASRIDLLAVQDILRKGGFAAASYQRQPHRKLKDIDGVVIVPLQVRGKCTLAQLTKSLSALRSAKTLVFVDRLTLVNNAKKPGALEVTLVLATLGDMEVDGS